jgi:chromosome segregation ATPase
MSNAPAAHSPEPLPDHSGRDHRCTECELRIRLRDAIAEIDLLRSYVAQSNDKLAKARSALFDESEAHAITNRRLQRLTGEKDAITEAFEDAREAVEILEKERDRRESEPDSNRTLGLVMS